MKKEQLTKKGMALLKGGGYNGFVNVPNIGQRGAAGTNSNSNTSDGCKRPDEKQREMYGTTAVK